MSANHKNVFLNIFLLNFLFYVLLAFDDQYLLSEYLPNNHLMQFQNDQTDINSHRYLQTNSFVYLTPIVNYLYNSNFSSRTACLIGICRYWIGFYFNNVANWIPNPIIQIGFVGYFDQKLTNITVVELSADEPTCLYQNALNLQYGLYRVIVQYKTNKSLTLQQNKFSLKIDHVLVALVTPPDHQFNNFSYDIYIYQNFTNKTIQLCGQGPINQADAVFILSVKLLRIGYYINPPTQNQTSPTQNQTSPTQNQTSPTQNQTSPTQNQTSPTQNQTSPTQNQNNYPNNYPNYYQNNMPTNQNNHLSEIMMSDYKFYQYFIINQYEVQGPLQQFILSTITSSQLSIFSKIPGLRQVFSRTFGFLVNFDHIWLYAYQHRKYGPLLRQIFDSILNFENNKWNFLSDGIYINQLNINVDQIKLKIDKKQFYQQIVHLILRRNGNSFFVNTVEFFIMNLPIVLLMFLLGKFTNYINKKYFKFSVLNYFLKQFQFNLIIFLMLLQGNFELFSYYFASDFFTFFYFNKFMRIQNILLMSLYFLFIMITLAGCFIAKWLYENNTFLSLQNNKFQKCLVFYIETTLFNFILGIVHLSTYKLIPYQIQILTCLQICYIITLIKISLKKNYKFFTKNRLWTTVLSSFLRIILNGTHKGFAKISNKQQARIIDNIYSVLTILYFANCFVLILVQVGILFFKIIKSIFNYRKKLITSNFQRKPRMQIFNIKNKQRQNKQINEQIIYKLKTKEDIIKRNIQKTIHFKPQKIVLQTKSKQIKVKYRNNNSNLINNIKKLMIEIIIKLSFNLFKIIKIQIKKILMSQIRLVNNNKIIINFQLLFKKQKSKIIWIQKMNNTQNFDITKQFKIMATITKYSQFIKLFIFTIQFLF